MYIDLREAGVIDSIEEFMHLTLGQIRFFYRKKAEYEALKKRTKELNDRLNQQKRSRQA